MKILLTGFEPFGSHRSNPSWDAAAALPETVGGVQIVKLKLPVSFRRFSALLEAAIERERPEGLICVGLAGREDKVSIERVGINLMEARIPDNDGFQPFDMPVRPDGDTAYFSTFPVKRMAKAVERRGIASCVSYSAGTFVCNAVLYTGLYLASSRYPSMKCCFIHVPYDETMEDALAGKPFMKREMLTELCLQCWKRRRRICAKKGSMVICMKPSALFFNSQESNVCRSGRLCQNRKEAAI